MTWIIAANTFNGATCAADVQATFPYKDPTRQPKYFDCVRKLHNIWKNAYLAFSGDIRIGLLIIADLKRACAVWYAPEENFSLEDGNLRVLQAWLARAYRNYAGAESPELQFMFLWNYQEGGDLSWTTGIGRFFWPDFRFSGTGRMQLDQCGSGLRSQDFRVLSEFLQGRRNVNDQAYERMFGRVEPSNVFTAKKVRNLLVREAARISFAGVSQSFTSVLMVEPTSVGWNEETDLPMLVQMLKKLGVQIDERKTRADVLRTFALDFSTVNLRVQQLLQIYPQQFREMSVAFTKFSLLTADRNWAAPHTIDEAVHHEDESSRRLKLCDTWEEVRAFMIARGMPPHAASAVA